MKKLLIAIAAGLAISACSPVPAVAAEPSQADIDAAYSSMVKDLSKDYFVIDDVPYSTTEIEPSKLRPGYVVCATINADNIRRNDVETATKYGKLDMYKQISGRAFFFNVNRLLHEMETNAEARRRCVKLL